ncbi:NAD(P)-binding domain-containing protein [Nocardioides sp. B-3]|uniref:NAD(P)-binding domain-containing protein n=1 Tax=Nocardioides sp. B-3 TaxID=2895565 RepID=UPI002153954D|nr:NAD(P)-binding domain-containing protein [Nocardioides sp. B-3]UUZ58327.1 NAD(P)-binding domain-containing protein [Nocardioides sp. B-3]
MQHPLVIIGAGPIGLAAAANAVERGMDFVVLEAGADAGAAIGEWAHVRLFSSWFELIDPAARRLPGATGTWTAPDDAGYPTGGEWREHYLQPLADLLNATSGGAIRYTSRVTGVGRAGRDLLVDSGREADEFAVHVEGPAGRERLLASAVVDASGTWSQPNPLGADGYPAPGETENARRITYGIPDFTDPAVAARYAGKHVAVAGKGASARGVPGRAGPARPAGRRHPGHPAAAPPERGRRVRRRRQRPARTARQARPGRQGGRHQRARDQRDPVPHRVRRRAGRRAADHRLGQRSAGHRRRRGHRGHRLPSRLRVPLRGPSGPGSDSRFRADPRQPDPPGPPLLWRRGPARVPGAHPARGRSLPRSA